MHSAFSHLKHILLAHFLVWILFFNGDFVKEENITKNISEQPKTDSVQVNCAWTELLFLESYEHNRSNDVTLTQPIT